MSEEEIHAIDEEQLDELSKATLGNYIKTSAHVGKGLALKSNDIQHNLQKIRDLELTVDNSNDLSDVRNATYRKLSKIDDKAWNREKGINRAVKKLTKEDTVSSQVASLLEAEGLSDEFKVQAVTIFEAAVTDRVLTIEEELKEEFETQLSEAKAELDNDIDGFLSEAIHQWKQENEVAIKSNFKTQLAESFMDGLMSLIKEHNIELPEGSEDALEVALGEVDKLTEEVSAKVAEMSSLQEQVNALKGEKILESFKSKMTTTEFDRFAQLTESVAFKDEAQYEKQLTVVLENFGKRTVTQHVTPEPVVEVVTEAVHKIVTESRDSSMDVYTKYLTKKY
jgi:heme-degrading monooxygenase HmoA